MRNHKKWIAISSYFKIVPINDAYISIIKNCLKVGKNVLILIKKEENPKYTPKEKFKHLCELFPKETKTGKIIVSSVPDIIEFIDID